MDSALNYADDKQTSAIESAIGRYLRDGDIDCLLHVNDVTRRQYPATSSVAAARNEQRILARLNPIIHHKIWDTQGVRLFGCSTVSGIAALRSLERPSLELYGKKIADRIGLSLSPKDLVCRKRMTTEFYNIIMWLGSGREYPTVDRVLTAFCEKWKITPENNASITMVSSQELQVLAKQPSPPPFR